MIKENKEFKVSVVIPTYNRVAYLGRAITSVLKQSHPVNEIIVIDNGSTDQTLSFIKKKFTRIRVITEKKRGVSFARNLGIKEAKSEYIALLDSDDCWLKGKLDRQVIAFRDDIQNRRLCHTDEIWVRNGIRVNQHKKHKKSGGNVFQSCLKLCCISPSSTMLHRSVFEDFGFFDEDLPACEDYDFWLRYSSKEEVIFINEPLIIKKGGHSDQLSGVHWGMDRFRIYALEKILNEPDLKLDYRIAAIREIILKMEILINGSQKRKKKVYAETLLEKKQYWEDSLRRCFND